MQVHLRLTRRHDKRQGAAPAVGREVNLRGQATAGASKGMVVRLAGRAPFDGPCRVLMRPHDRGVDGDDPFQVAFHIGLGCKAVNTSCQVPSTAHTRSRLRTPFTTQSVQAGPSMASRCGT